MKGVKKIDQRKLQSQPQKVPRYEILLEKGRMYTIDREQRANASKVKYFYFSY